MFEGIRKFQTDNKLEVDGIMKPEGETETTFNKMLRKGEYASSAAQQGLSFGWADEAEGVMGGIGYGLGSLNKNWNKNGESFKDAFARGYEKNRDERRNILKEAYENEPVMASVSEAVGAGLSPVKFAKASPAAPLDVIRKKNLLDAVTSGSVYGAGISEDDAKGYAKGIGLGIGGNAIGYGLSKGFFGSGRNRPVARSIMSAVSNQSTQSFYNRLFEDK